MEQNPGQSQEEAAKQAEPVEGISSEIVAAGGPKPPKGMSEAEANKIRTQALALMKQLGDATGSKEMEILDDMSNMGVQTQRNSAGYLDLLKARVSTFLSDGGPSREIANSMRDLRIALDQIDPHAKPKSVWDKIYNVFPFFGGTIRCVFCSESRSGTSLSQGRLQL